MKKMSLYNSSIPRILFSPVRLVPHRSPVTPQHLPSAGASLFSSLPLHSLKSVVYLSRADKSCGPLSGRLRGMNQTVINPRIRFSRPRSALDSGFLAQLPHRVDRYTTHYCHSRQSRYSTCGCGHGGTRKSNTSRRVHTRSVSPAAIAGVRGRHCVAEPVPLVGRGCGNGMRRLAWGKQKL